jgi:ribosomal protein L11 methyltransferase
MNTSNKTSQTIPHALWRVTLRYGQTLDEAQGQALFEAFEEEVVSVFLHNREATDGNDWHLTLTTYGEPDLDALHARANEILALPRASVTAERLPEQDWLLHVHQNFPPVHVGRFFIYGSHYEGDKPADKTTLLIDAATAFGSGEHETTRGCLMALEALCDSGFSPSRVLDMGCGSGILAIAACKLWPASLALGIDIDPESVVVTHRHASVNGVAAQVMAEAGDGYAAPRVGSLAPYDLIFANILAGPLVEMAPDAAKNLAKNGRLILSGLLNRQRDDVIAAHEAQGLVLVDDRRLNDWHALVFAPKA